STHRHGVDGRPDPDDVLHRLVIDLDGGLHPRPHGVKVQPLHLPVDVLPDLRAVDAGLVAVERHRRRARDRLEPTPQVVAELVGVGDDTDGQTTYVATGVECHPCHPYPYKNCVNPATVSSASVAGCFSSDLETG